MTWGFNPNSFSSKGGGLGGLTDFLMGPGGKFVYSILGGQADQEAAAGARAANEERFDIGTQLGMDSMLGGMATYDAGAQQQLQALQQMAASGNSMAQQLVNQMNTGAQDRTSNVMAGFDQGANRLMGGYRDRYNTAERNLEGYGQQMSADIDRRFANERSTLEQDLISRGLMSSTSGAKDLLGVQERASAEQRRLGEDLMRNRVGILSDLSGQGLQAEGGLQQARAAYDSALRGDELNTMGQMGQWQQGVGDQYGTNLANFHGVNAQNRTGIFQQGLGNLQNLYVNRNDSAPPQNDRLAQNFGWGAPKAPSGGDGGENAMWGQIGGAAISMIPMLFSDSGAKAPAATSYSGSFNVWSDESSKDGFTLVDGQKVLERLEDVPVSVWQYRDDPSDTEHIGPMAQDFKRAFGVGDSDKHIHGVDAIGVLMASVKALAEKVVGLEKRIA